MNCKVTGQSSAFLFVKNLNGKQIFNAEESIYVTLAVLASLVSMGFCGSPDQLGSGRMATERRGLGSQKAQI